MMRVSPPFPIGPTHASSHTFGPFEESEGHAIDRGLELHSVTSPPSCSVVHTGGRKVI